MSRIKHFLPVSIWALVVLFLSITPSDKLPEAHFRFADKAAHLVVYAFLSFLLLKDYQRFRPGVVGWKVITCLFLISGTYGVGIEIIQEYMIPSRFGEWQDALANCLGAVFGLIVGFTLGKRSLP